MFNAALRDSMLTLPGLISLLALIFLIIIVANASFRVLRQYERAVLLTLGRTCRSTRPASRCGS
jgi:regulator of protease activity HflC (stomatin/prohibitin superfamily)